VNRENDQQSAKQHRRAQMQFVKMQAVVISLDDLEQGSYVVNVEFFSFFFILGGDIMNQGIRKHKKLQIKPAPERRNEQN
jgi:hypothetical protein